MIGSLLLGIVGMNVLAAALVIGRSAVYRTKLYRPMLLNIGLSVVPLIVLLVGLVVTVLASIAKNTVAVLVVGIVCAVVWLLALPNSNYLITELNLSHRRDDDPVPMWFDVILVISLAMSGVLNLVLNVLIVQILYGLTRYGDEAAALQRADVRLLAFLLLFLCAVGVYLGRFLRLNSWDVRHPGSLIRKVRSTFTQDGAVRTFLGFTLLHTVFIGLIYLTVAGTVIDSLVMIETVRDAFAPSAP